jgi:cell division protein FtsW
VVLTFGLTGVLIMAQPNLGTTMIIFLIMIAMVFVGGSPMRWILGLLAAGGAAAAAFAILFPWRMARIDAFRDPWKDTLGVGYQIINAQSAAANGGLTGTGLGQSRAKWGYLPEAQTDFIFAIIAEELGFFGALLVIVLFVALAFLGVRAGLQAQDPFGRLLAIGITTWLTVQAFVNIGAVIGVLPITGVPLPFISFGGSSLLATMAASGILLNVARSSGDRQPVRRG